MFSKLKAAWARMTGGRAAGESDEPSTPAIEYQGYRIRPTPYRTEGQYQTAGIIEKNFPDGPSNFGKIGNGQGKRRADSQPWPSVRFPAIHRRCALNLMASALPGRRRLAIALSPMR
jgi:Transcriptional activator HlyU